MEGPIRIIIADDHPIVREGLVRTIDREKAYSIVGQAGDGAEALRLIEEHHPDVALLDVTMPIMDGLDVAKRVQQRALLTELIFLTMHKDPEYLNAAMDLGVRGYLVKESVSSDLIACLKAVTTGQHYVSPVISHLLIERRARAAMPSDTLPLRERLTPAEVSVLRLVAENKTNKEIAHALCVSTRTVENHRARICSRLGIKGHNELLLFAREHRGEF
jgi:DNA-binding NarL/FixJ family response regulator